MNTFLLVPSAATADGDVLPINSCCRCLPTWDRCIIDQDPIDTQIGLKYAREISTAAAKRANQNVRFETRRKAAVSSKVHAAGTACNIQLGGWVVPQAS